jgi:amidase
VPMDGRPLGWTPISVLGPMGRSVADLRLLFSAQIGMDDREPLAFPLDRIAIATARPVDLGRLRMAFTEDFGRCPVSAEVRRVFRSRIAAMRHLFSTCDEVKFDFGEADRCFDVVRAQSYVDRYRDAYAKDPNSLGPNVRANYEMAAHMTLADMAWAHAEQTRIFRRFQASFRDYDFVLSPTAKSANRIGDIRRECFFLNHDIGRQLVGASTLIAGFHSRFVSRRGRKRPRWGFLSGAAGGTR